MLLPIVCTILCAALATAGLYLVRRLKSGGLRVCFSLLIFLLVGVFFEVFLFNINYYRSHTLTPVNLNTYADYHTDEYTLTQGNRSVEYSGIDLEIQNIRIDIEDLYGTSAYGVTVYCTDDAGITYGEGTERIICPSVEKSCTLNLNLSGNCHKLLLVFDITDAPVKLYGVTGNVTRPFDFTAVRVLALFSLLALLYLFRPRSFLYKTEYLKQPAVSKPAVTYALSSLITLISVLTMLNPLFVGIAGEHYNENKWDGDGIDLIAVPWTHHMQYDDLAKSLMNGHLYLEDEVPISLIAMENPYDPAERSVMSKATGDDYRWDCAYYNGRYYVYFGIVPELLLYLPCRLLTSSPFPSSVGVALFLSLFAGGVFLLLGEIVKRYYRKTSLGVYLLLALGFVGASGTLFLAKRPDFYGVPIASGLAFTVFGLSFWLMSLNKEKRTGRTMLLGSLCMALAVGCRPQLALVSFAAVPLFYGSFFREKRLLTKKGILDAALFALPYLVIGAGLMAYNYLRFDSVLEFGSSFNLTTNDVSARGFQVGRIGLGLFTYLFQSPHLTAIFPFLNNVNIETNYIGTTIYENCFGGLLTCTPLLWFVFAAGIYRDKLREKKTLLLTVLFTVLGTIIVIADTEAGGLLQRYFSDFGFLFFIAASMVALAAQEIFTHEKNRRGFVSVLLTFTVLSILYNILLVLSRSDMTLDKVMPALYYTIAHSVQFWL